MPIGVYIRTKEHRQILLRKEERKCQKSREESGETQTIFLCR